MWKVFGQKKVVKCNIFVEESASIILDNVKILVKVKLPE